MKNKLILLGVICYTSTALASLALAIEGNSILRLWMAAAFGFLAVQQYRKYTKASKSAQA